MRMHRSNPLRVSSLRPLAASLAILFNTAVNGHASEVMRTEGLKHANTQQTWQVLNCNDTGASSLRDIIQNHAQSGDIVDLRLLPVKCGTSASKITLLSGEIAVAQDELTLIGPEGSSGSVTISGSPTSRVFNQSGMGFLYIQALTISDGHFESSGIARGGCIESLGQVHLLRSSVVGCTVSSTSQTAFGGGIDADSVYMMKSTVSGNEALVASDHSYGGGISCRSLTAKYSSISSNVAHDGGLPSGFGGGVYVTQYAHVVNSTIDYNTAGSGGGLVLLGQGRIVGSTISGNFADQDFGALKATTDYLAISNSTIAFNYSTSAFAGPKGAVGFVGTSSTSTLMLQSSIVAKNTAGSAGTPADIYLGYGYYPHEALSGADNLVIASNALAAPDGVITVTSDPLLGPLSMNGGPTRTHALHSASPAIGAGNNSALSEVDQRGRGYPRTTGAALATDIGAFQFDTIFFDDFD